MADRSAATISSLRGRRMFSLHWTKAIYERKVAFVGQCQSATGQEKVSEEVKDAPLRPSKLDADLCLISAVERNDGCDS